MLSKKASTRHSLPVSAGAWDQTERISTWLRAPQPSVHRAPGGHAQLSKAQSPNPAVEASPTLRDFVGAVCVLALPIGLLFAGAGLF